MQHITPASQLPDGTYTWVAVTAWAGQPMSATVAAGRVTAWEYINEDGTTTPAAWPYQLERSNAEHYRFAARALGQNVESLAALTVEQARKVWAALLSAYPQAKALAA